MVASSSLPKHKNTEQNENDTKTYSYEECLKRSTDYFGGDDLAAKVYADKYALRDNKNNLLESTPLETHKRLAKEFARIESKYKNPMSEEEIFAMFDHFKYVVPQGSPMSAIGNNYQLQSASNCFVIESPYDSYGGILKTDQEQAQIMKRRGGVGFDISTIRPKDMPTSNAARTTDGIGVFMQRYSNTTREVAQNGRRGALMLTISVHHPEIRTFINIKRDRKKVTGANISIRLSDEFMIAVRDKKDVELRWPVDSKNPTISVKTPAIDLWNEIIQSAWECAEPGLLFWDTALRMTPADIYADLGYRSVATNPCGEIILSVWDSCRLMVINTMSFVANPFTSRARFDYKKFQAVAEKAQRLMDDLVDIELEQINKILAKIAADPEPAAVKRSEREMWEKIKVACENGRRTGLGLTALGDTLAALGLRYGSDESISETESIYKNLAIGSYRSSCILAKERGAFPIFDAKLEKGHPFLERIWEAAPDVYAIYKKYGRRNIANLTTAPVGSMSTLTQTTSGIECAFLLEYDRSKKINMSDVNARVDKVDALGDRWQVFRVYHHAFKQWMEITGKTKVEDSPYFKATSRDVDWVQSVKLQAAAQKWICHAISKTCNLPNDVTQSMVADVYMAAWTAGCKGFTVYRDGCRDGVLNDIKVPSRDANKIIKTDAPKRPDELPCSVHHIKVRGADYFVLVGLYGQDQEPYEVFAGLNGFMQSHTKTGSVKKIKRGLYEAKFDDGTSVKNITEYITDDQAALTRSVSTSLRHGVDVGYVVHQLEKARGEMSSFCKALARALKHHIKDGTKVSGESCDSCGSTSILRKEGCVRALIADGVVAAKGFISGRTIKASC